MTDLFLGIGLLIALLYPLRRYSRYDQIPVGNRIPVAPRFRDATKMASHYDSAGRPVYKHDVQPTPAGGVTSTPPLLSQT